MSRKKIDDWFFGESEINELAFTLPILIMAVVLIVIGVIFWF